MPTPATLPVAWACASSLFVLFGIYLLFALHIRLDLGRWPVPMFEQYPEPPLVQLHGWVLLLWGYFSVFAAGPLWLLCQFVQTLRPRSMRTIVWQLASLLGGWVCIFLFCEYDPTPFTDWFLD